MAAVLFHLVLRQLHSGRLRTSGSIRSATLGQFQMLCAVLPVRHARPVQDALRGPRYRCPHDLHDWPVSRRSQTLRGSCRPCTRTGRGLPLRRLAPGVARPRRHPRVVHPRGAPGYPSLRRPLQGTPRSGAASRAFATTGMFRGPFRHARPVQDALRGPRYRCPHDLHDWPVSRRSPNSSRLLSTLHPHRTRSAAPAPSAGRGAPETPPPRGAPSQRSRVPLAPTPAPGYPSLRRRLSRLRHHGNVPWPVPPRSAGSRCSARPSLPLPT